MAETARPLILWDGECGFCRASVEWIRSRRGGERLYAIPYQNYGGPEMTASLRANCRESVHVFLQDGGVLRGGQAVLFLLSETEWPNLGRVGGLPPFSWAVELGYKFVAARRQWFSKWMFRSKK